MGAYSPPAGSQDIPHPRTAADIVVRTLSIHGFAAVSYAHLCFVLGWRKPHGAAALPVALVAAFVLLPEFLLLQLSFAVLPVLIARPYRRRVAERFAALPRELGAVAAGGRTRLWRLGLHAAFGVLNAFPFAAVVGAYRQRLGMRYHQLTYVANLGLDHRNGWVAISGLVAVAVLQAVLAGLAAAAVAGRASGDGATELAGGRGAGAAGDAGPDAAAPRGMAGVVARVDWSSVSELVYVAGIHQFMLAATNHPVPVLVMARAWYVWPPVVGAGVYLYARRRVGRDTLLFYAALGLIVATVASQLWWDVRELRDVHAGRLQPWNFRWQVKDRVSASYAVDG